jgi:microcystin degradation protein MlrC
MMHGAIYVDDIDDPEGEWIELARKVVGKDCIISLSYDLHGQLTDKIVGNIDAFAAFRTAPHIDINRTYHRAARMLSDMLASGQRMSVVWCPVPVLVSGEMSSTLAEPCRSIYAQLDEFDKSEGIIDCNLLVGYVWADTARATAAAVVTCTSKKSGSKVCTQIAKLYWQSRHQLTFDMESGDIDSALARLPQEFSIIADSGDNPTAGGVGDRADVLKAILSHGIERTLFAAIASERAYRELKKAKEFVIGNGFGGGGPELKLSTDSIYFKNQCAIVSLQNVTLVVSKYRRPFHQLSDFRELQINLDDYRLLVVKSGYLAPELQNLSAPSFMVLSDGAVNQDLSALTNNHRNQPSYPFQELDEFAPKPSFGSKNYS